MQRRRHAKRLLGALVLAGAGLGAVVTGLGVRMLSAPASSWAPPLLVVGALGALAVVSARRQGVLR